MDRSTLLIFGLLVGLAVIGGVAYFQDQGARAAEIRGPILTQEDAVARVVWAIRPEHHPQAIDARLMFHQEASEALGNWESYDRPGIKYGLRTPVWVVTVLADSVADLPMANAGVTRTQRGVIFMVNAVDGSVPFMLTITGKSDEVAQRVRALPNRAGSLPIQRSPLETPPAAVPTATPAPISP
ncbi:MAG TPA: hypothetical protein DEP84_00420 [Chloroflexi bacterium]|nr:hypothetical protein [Chloroflexota bacterium]